MSRKIIHSLRVGILSDSAFCMHIRLPCCVENTCLHILTPPKAFHFRMQLKNLFCGKKNKDKTRVLFWDSSGVLLRKSEVAGSHCSSCCCDALTVRIASAVFCSGCGLLSNAVIRMPMKINTRPQDAHEESGSR